MPAATDLRRFRVVSFAEGVSYLLLLGGAMPLKYFADLPLAVRVVGSIHGALFVLYCLALAKCFFGPAKLSFWTSTKYFVLSLIPFGMILVERELKAKDHSSP